MISDHDSTVPFKEARSPSEQLLVGVLNSFADLEIIREACWYRIPIPSAEKWLARRWPPQWLAFYQTKVFGAEAFAVNYCARVREIRPASRQQLFPDEPPGPKSAQRYFQLLLDPLQRLPRPIISKRWRRIVFIPTTWGKFVRA